MIDLYTAPTPNGHKVSILLEELGVPYRVIAVDLSRGDQHRAQYLKLNPSGRIPTIVDQDAKGFAVFESGAILLYLAEKYGRFLPKDSFGRSRAMQWLMFQMAGIGPAQAHATLFYRDFPEQIPVVIDRFQSETARLYQVLERQLSEHPYLAQEYSIADIATYPWIRRHNWAGVSVKEFPHLRAWMDRISHRPAVQRGLEIPQRIKNEAAEASVKPVLVR